MLIHPLGRARTRRTVHSGLCLTLIACSGSSDGDPPGTCTNISGSVTTTDGLSIRRPEEDAAGCKITDNTVSPTPATVCAKKDPDLSCLGVPEPLGTPIAVTYTGCVNSFGLEAQSDDLTVTVLRELEAATPVDPGYDLDGPPGQQGENTPSALLGRTLSTRVSDTECADLGAFSIAGIPTETNLIVRVTDQQREKSDRQYVDTYQYNIILRNRSIRSGATKTSSLVPDPGTYCSSNPCYVVDDVNTIFETTFRSVALAAGVSVIRGQQDLYDGDGQGHLAGEVQDCTSEDTVQNAVVAVDTEVRKLAYFNVGFPPDPDNVDDPKVEGSRTRTNADGLFAAIAVDVPSGGKPVKAGAAITRAVCGKDAVCMCVEGKPNPAYSVADEGEGESTVLAVRTVYIYPDSITILTFDRQLYTRP